MTGQAGMAGYPPTVLIKPIEVNPERAKYEKLWQREEYRRVAPGEHWAMTFLAQARVEPDADVVDFGCGTGRGGLVLALLGKMRVTLLDFVPGCLDEEVAQACETQPTRIRFVQADLTKTLPVSAAYGYCCDVMEHIPTADVPAVLRNIIASAQHCFFAISTVDDVMGELIGETLHLTVKPMAWWVDQITKIGAVVHWSEEKPGACAIYCTAWRDASEVVKIGHINTDVAIVDEQIATNIRAGWAHVQPHDRQDREVVVLAGGRALAGLQWTVGASAKSFKFDATDLIFTASGSSLINVKFAVIGTSGAKALCWSKLSTAAFTVTSPNTLTIQFNTLGIFEMH